MATVNLFIGDQQKEHGDWVTQFGLEFPDGTTTWAHITGHGTEQIIMLGDKKFDVGRGFNTILNAYGERMRELHITSITRPRPVERRIRVQTNADIPGPGAPVAATADDWDVTYFTDDTGVWTNLQVYDREAEQASDSDERVLAVSLLLSDVEAATLAKFLADRTEG